MELNEFLLLESKTYENYFRQFSDDKIKRIYSKVGLYSGKSKIEKMEEIAQALRDLDPTSTNTTVGRFADFIIKTYDHEFVDLNYKEVLTCYENNSSLFPKTIEKYRSFSELWEDYKKIMSRKSLERLKTKPDFEYNNWYVKRIRNFKDACELGRGTKWCTTQNNSAFRYYASLDGRRKLFYLYHGNRRYAVITDDRSGEVKYFNEKDKQFSGERIPHEVLNFMFGVKYAD
jgi:hypothetical protein